MDQKIPEPEPAITLQYRLVLTFKLKDEEISVSNCFVLYYISFIFKRMSITKTTLQYGLRIFIKHSDPEADVAKNRSESVS